jgi:hypothetical protein
VIAPEEKTVIHITMKRDTSAFWRAIGLAGMLSTSILLAGVTKPFPAHWGDPPKIQTRDYVRLPGGYGQGSSTLASWIAGHLEKDKASGPTSSAPAAKAAYENNLENAVVGQVPADFLVLNGTFSVQQADGNKFLEVPGAPADDYAVLFGPSEKDGLAVTARVYGTATGRRFPVLAVGLNGLGGYELQVAPAKQALELFKGEERVLSVPYRWESGTWTMLQLQVRKVGDAHWMIEGKAWKHATPEPGPWMIAYDEKNEPPAGRPLISGHPFSGTPIRFDDLVIRRIAEKN